MVGRVVMIEWLVGYSKEFLFYSVISGEHRGNKQNHSVFCFTLKNIFLIVISILKGSGMEVGRPV